MTEVSENTQVVSETDWGRILNKYAWGTEVRVETSLHVIIMACSILTLFT